MQDQQTADFSQITRTFQDFFQNLHFPGFSRISRTLYKPSIQQISINPNMKYHNQATCIIHTCTTHYMHTDNFLHKYRYLIEKYMVQMFRQNRIPPFLLLQFASISFYPSRGTTLPSKCLKNVNLSFAIYLLHADVIQLLIGANVLQSKNLLKGKQLFTLHRS